MLRGDCCVVFVYLVRMIMVEGKQVECSCIEQEVELKGEC